MNKFNLKKGLNIPVAGIPKQVIEDTKIPNSVAVLGPDYNGLKPKMLINVGEKVKRGTPLFCHKDNPEVFFVSPCKGFVKEINRGEKRVLLSVVIDIDDLDFVENKKISNSEMYNILGSEILEYRKKTFKKNEFFFDYGKKEIKEKRKMGHLTILKK